MEKFEVTILGCGSATPSHRHYTSSQVVNIREKLFMVDCGEGTQIQIRRSRIAFAKINHILISHLHGDHCFGLIGMLSSFGLLGRTAPLYIHAPADMWNILEKELAFYCSELEFEVVFQGFDPAVIQTIYEDRSVRIDTIPLKHRIPCAGFLFLEKPVADHLNREMADFYKVPQWDFGRIKDGGDFTMPDGTVIPHSRLTYPADPPRSYAYCCDTEYNPEMINQLKGVNLIYHDCTYSVNDVERARLHHHSTAVEAAKTALAAGASHLALGHFSARYDDESILLREAQEIFPDTVLSKEGLTIPVN
ncbi:MAG: ribonuclease Z [Bacteroidaceae bacterium]|nr:ribonuclease Z [Bacteroidaceae bacterium]